MPQSSTCLRFLGYAIRAIVVLAYIVWIVTGYYILRHDQVDPSHLRFIATRHLPAGQRLHLGDFTFDPPIPARDRSQLPPDSNPVGKYLKHKVFQSKPIDLDDLSMAPVIQMSAGKVKYFFSLQNQMDLVDILNTDSRVDVCATTCAVEDARVVTIVCTGSPSKCSAVLELTKKRATAIFGQGKDDYRLVLRGDSGR